MAKIIECDSKEYVLKNRVTGEDIELDLTEKCVEYTDAHFWKAKPEFFQCMLDFNEGETKVAAYVMQRLMATTNKFCGTIRGVARTLGCTQQTVRKALTKMNQQKMIVAAESNGKSVWMFNPRYIVKGDSIKEARIMAEFDRYCGKSLSDWSLVDTYTGEPFQISQDAADQLLARYPKGFWKLYEGYFAVISGLSSADMKVMNYFLTEIEYSNNQILGTMREISAKTKCSTRTVGRAIETLKEKLFLVRVQNGVWMINPTILVRGNANKQRRLIDKYNEAQRKEVDRKKKKQ